jgi:hypothetical protein
MPTSVGVVEHREVIPGGLHYRYRLSDGTELEISSPPYRFSVAPGEGELLLAGEDRQGPWVRSLLPARRITPSAPRGCYRLDAAASTTKGILTTSGPLSACA